MLKLLLYSCHAGMQSDGMLLMYHEAVALLLLEGRCRCHLAMLGPAFGVLQCCHVMLHCHAGEHALYAAPLCTQRQTDALPDCCRLSRYSVWTVRHPI